MKDIIKNKLAIIGLLILSITIFFVSCSDDEFYNFPGNSGKVYLRLRSSNMVNSVPNVINGSISKNILGIFGDPRIKFPVSSTMPVSRSIKVDVNVDNSLVTSYNSKHKTSYKTLDMNAITFSSNTLIIKEGQMISGDSIEIGLNTAALQNIEVGEYLVPVKLQSVSGDLSVSQDWNTIYWIISVSTGIEDVPVSDRTGWTIVGYSSEDEYEENLAVNVLDGSLRTIWHTEWYSSQPNPPHFITIDMGKEVNMAGFQYVTRNNGTGAPAELTVAVSLDGEEWNEVGIYTKLPIGASVEYRTLFEKVKETRYFRITITKTQSNVHYTSLAEINAFIIDN